jgi:hypothetical protein
VFADTLMQLERLFLERLLLWGALSVAVGVLVLVGIGARRVHTPLLRHFAAQTALWGCGVLAFGAVRLHTVVIRDLASAARLDSALRLDAALALAVAGVGLVLAIAAIRFGPRPAAIGAGVAVAVQGVVLFLIHAQIIRAIRL